MDYKNDYQIMGLKRHPGVNPAGVALALDLLAEVKRLTRQLRRLSVCGRSRA